jgi:hypothetical protein
VRNSKAVSAIRCGRVYCKVQCVSTAHHQNGPSKLACYPYLGRAASSDPPLRASNDHRFIVGVPRARTITEAALHPLCSRSSGPHSFSQSIFSSFSLLGVAWLNPQLRASNEGLPRPRVARATGVHQATPSLLTALSSGSYNSRYGLGRNALIQVAQTIHECRREAFETEARRGFSQVRPT